MCAYGVYRNSLSDCLIRDWIWIDFGEGYVFIFKINISKFIIKRGNREKLRFYDKYKIGFNMDRFLFC